MHSAECPSKLKAKLEIRKKTTNKAGETLFVSHEKILNITSRPQNGEETDCVCVCIHGTCWLAQLNCKGTIFFTSFITVAIETGLALGWRLPRKMGQKKKKKK